MDNKRYTVPRLRELSLIVVSAGPVRLTARQLCVLILGTLLAHLLWRTFPPFVPFFVRGGCVFVLLATLLPFGWITLEGRSLESWLLVLVRYLCRLHLALWRPLLDELSAPDTEREERER